MLYAIFGLKYDIQFEKLCEKCNINQLEITMWKIQFSERTLTLAWLAFYFMLSPNIILLIIHTIKLDKYKITI